MERSPHLNSQTLTQTLNHVNFQVQREIILDISRTKASGLKIVARLNAQKGFVTAASRKSERPALCAERGRIQITFQHQPFTKLD